MRMKDCSGGSRRCMKNIPIWGIDGEGDSSVIAEHIRRIRAKLAAAGAQKQYIETVWGVGYKWAK